MGRRRHRSRAVRRLFHGLILEWYADYFAHPLWRSIREGRLGRPRLIAWIVHNYMISCSVGRTAARAAVQSPQKQHRSVFLVSALEEYPNCRDYFHFHVRHPELGISEDELLSYVPLPSNTAFDHQMLRIAEEDVLAHMLVGYMQETTAHFIADYRDFYADVESQYSLFGFFDSWLAHVRLDLDYGHADGFGDALSAVTPVGRTDLESSLRNAWATYIALRQGLDEVQLLDQGDETAGVRQPLSTGARSLSGYFLSGGSHVTVDLTGATTYLEIADRLPNLLGPKPNSCELDSADATFMRGDFGRTILRAMAHAESEPSVLMMGNALESWADDPRDRTN